MRLSHTNITMPKVCEEIVRSFYAGLLGLKEIPKPESIRGSGVWFEAEIRCSMFSVLRLPAARVSHYRVAAV